MVDSFQDRISYKGPYVTLGRAICREYRLGHLTLCTPILTGYEDFNVRVGSSKGDYVAKIFSDSRSLEDCVRNVDIMQKVQGAGVSTPQLHRSAQGYLTQMEIEKQKIRLCVMDFIDGGTFYSRGSRAMVYDASKLGRQAALIGRLDLKPTPVYDSWSITNFVKEFAEKGNCLQDDDRKLVEPVLDAYRKLNLLSLPQSFVHGDIISTNVIRDTQDTIRILDFSVSNSSARILELAVLGCDLLFDPLSKTRSEMLVKTALDAYQEVTTLTAEELHVLPRLIKAAHAMHVLEAGFEKYVKKNHSAENRYFLNLGWNGLAQDTMKLT